MLDSSVNPLVSSLKEQGKVIAKSLRDVKNQDQPNNIIIHQVTNAITNITQKLNNPQLPSSCPETVIPKLLEKIQATLQKFSKFDPNNAKTYEELARKVGEYQPKKHYSKVGSAATPSTPQGNQLLLNQDTHLRDLKSLSEKERNCLISFCLFSPGKEVRKREPINMWISLDLIHDSTEGYEMLAMLESEGFVERTKGNKKLCNRYKISQSVRSKVLNETGNKIEENGSLSILHFQPTSPQEPAAATKSPAAPTSIPQQTTLLQRLGTFKSKDNQGAMSVQLLVLNRSENTLSVKTVERVFKKSSVKVLHLGCWDHDHKRYIMVEDMDILKNIMKSMGQATFLSLQGISGIVELPDSVYRLENLKILDLRACPNLESLPEGIDSLKNLTHLDLSECYLLGHIPSKITSLTSLRVLKGLVINPEDQEEGNENGNENKIGKEKNSATRSVSFSELSKLKELIKLTIRTRRMNFPTSKDFDALCSMEKLVSLRIAWVSSSVDSPSAFASGRLPSSLKKLELQAAPENTMSRLIRLVSEDTGNTLEKLYIRGGRLRELRLDMHCFCHVHTVRLRYLQELRIDWDEFKKIFPKLTRLDVSGCPDLIFFPCDDNGVWEETYIGYSP